LNQTKQSESKKSETTNKELSDKIRSKLIGKYSQARQVSKEQSPLQTRRTSHNTLPDFDKTTDNTTDKHT